MGKHINADVFVEDIETLTNEEWLAKRRFGIGGSDAPCIMGEGFRKASQIWMDKLGLSPDNDLSPKTELLFTLGHTYEPIVLSLYDKAMGVTHSLDRHMYKSKTNPFMLGDCDAVLEILEEDRTVGIEVKTYLGGKAAGKFASGILGQGGVLPHGYEWQVRHYMSVLDLDEFRVLAFPLGSINPDDLDIITVYRDYEKEEKLIAEEAEFWRKVQERIAPLDTEETYVLPASPQPANEDGEIEFSPLAGDFLKKLAELDEKKADLNAKIKELEGDIEKYRTPIITELTQAGKEKGHRVVDNIDYSVSFQGSTRTSISTAKLKSLYPAVYNDLATPQKTAATFKLKVSNV